MKKLSYVLLVILTTISLPSGAAEKVSVNASNFLCDLFGIGCPIVVSTSDTTPDADGGGNGKEPPTQG